MADVKISELPATTSSSGGDLYVLVQSNTTKQITYANLFTNVTLTTPNIGTPSAGTLTNCTGLPISTGVSGLGANVATFLGSASSANLAAAMTDETGTGALVFANSPTLVTPVLGVPTAGDLTNCGGSPTFTDIKRSGVLATTTAASTIGLTTTDETIAPAGNIVLVSATGVESIATITPPAVMTGGGQITLIPTGGAFTTTLTGNIALASTAVVSKALIMTYDSGSGKWYPSY